MKVFDYLMRVLTEVLDLCHKIRIFATEILFTLGNLKDICKIDKCELQFRDS